MTEIIGDLQSKAENTVFDRKLNFSMTTSSGISERFVVSF